MKIHKFKVQPIKGPDLGRVNKVYIAKKHADPAENFLSIGSTPFKFEVDASLPPDAVCLNKAQREGLRAIINNEVDVTFPSTACFESASLLRLRVTPMNLGRRTAERAALAAEFHAQYSGFPFTTGQQFFFLAGDLTLQATVDEVATPTSTGTGVLRGQCTVHFSAGSAQLSLVGGDAGSPLLRGDFSFEELGIGGLRREFAVMFRRAFVQRVFDRRTVAGLGLPHVKGILLYGPPGTGKTLIARQIGALLDAKPPKVVSGPEILNKFVGQSEENIRALFAEAEEDYRALKENAPLHIIIFDELDAIFRTRGQTTAGIGDQVVNQLLAKMDGVEALDNILVIGMTNRPDMIDRALLRPGRFEIHIEISLPDEDGRREILLIHTRAMDRSNMLNSDVDIPELARLARNFTGAELQALIKSAASFALERRVQAKKKSDHPALETSDGVCVTMADFVCALDEVKPAFGFDSTDFSLFNKVFYELPTFMDALRKIDIFLAKLRSTNAYTTSSLLLHGPPGCGKTNLAVKAAVLANCPFVKMISPKHLVGMSENEKVNSIKERFQDAYKSSESIIILDEIETLIDYVAIGPRFSNNILQAIKIFVKNEEKNKLFVIGTTSEKELLAECGLLDCFYTDCEISMLDNHDLEFLCQVNSDFREIKYTKPLPIKTVLSLLNAPPKAFS